MFEANLKKKKKSSGELEEYGSVKDVLIGSVTENRTDGNLDKSDILGKH